MATLLSIHSSSCGADSLSRALSKEFVTEWMNRKQQAVKISDELSIGVFVDDRKVQTYRAPSGWVART